MQIQVFVESHLNKGQINIYTKQFYTWLLLFWKFVRYNSKYMYFNIFIRHKAKDSSNAILSIHFILHQFAMNHASFSIQILYNNSPWITTVFQWFLTHKFAMNHTHDAVISIHLSDINLSWIRQFFQYNYQRRHELHKSTSL